MKQFPNPSDNNTNTTPWDSRYDIAHRLAHLDLKGMPPTPQRLIQWLDVIAMAGYNGLLVEWEDSFPWQVDPRFASPTAYDLDFIAHFHHEAARRNLQVIPLVQTLGHMEMVLRLPEYEALREKPDRYDSLLANSDQGRDLVLTMISEVLETMPTQPRYMHIGGDEAWHFAQHPSHADYLKDHDKADLFIAHYQPIFDWLNQRNIRPIIWHDMLRGWSDATIKQLADHTDIMAWGYQDHPDTANEKQPHHHRHLDLLSRCNIELWGAAAFKGAKFPYDDLPDTDQRLVNTRGWVDVAKRYKLKGIANTGWSRYSTFRLQCCPMEGALDVLAATGELIIEGQLPDNAIAHWQKRLVDAGHTDLPAIKQCLSQISSLRERSWDTIRKLRENTVMMSLDSRYEDLRVDDKYAYYIADHLRELHDLADEFRTLMSSKVPEIWVDRYLAERLLPIEQAFDDARQVQHISTH